MNKLISIFKSLWVLTLGIATIGLSGCGGSGGGIEGEVIGLSAGENWKQYVPWGMVVVPSGTFHMGQADENIAHSMINFNKQVTIGGFYMDETETTNMEYRQFVAALKSTEDTAGGFGGLFMQRLKLDLNGILTSDNRRFEDLDFEELLLQVYPDTTVWRRDFTHHMGDPMQEYYFAHPAFDMYPVVGVNWKAAKVFCSWRTAYLNDYRKSIDLPVMPKFRLPSEAEWEYAARGGRDLVPYPWGGPYIRNQKGCMLANFKPGRGNYYDDGFSYTAPVGSFFANDYGLWDMSGNVAEWCEDAFFEASVPLVWDLNPTYFDNNETRKVIRGGSWKDIFYFCRTGTKTFEYADTAKSYVGFRCAVTYLGRSSGLEF